MSRLIEQRRFGLIFVAAWFLITAAVQLFDLKFDGLSVAMGLLAAAAGVLLLLDR